MPKTPDGKAKSPAKGKGKSDLHLGVVARELKKSAKYFQVPKTLIKMKAPPNKVQQWFDFTSGSYFPIGIMDKAGELVVSSRPVTMEISYHNKMYKPIEPALIGPSPPKNGIYWFSLFKAFVFGEIHVKFSVLSDGGEEVADYEERIVIDRDENGNENAEVPEDLSDLEEDDETAKKKSSKKKKKKSGDAIVITFDDIESDEDIELPAEKKKASHKKKRTESFASDGGKDLEVEEAKPSKKKVKKAKAAPTITLVPDKIMPESLITPTAPRNRLYRSPLYDAETGKSEKIVVEGATLSITMPLSLTFALLDDECKVKTNFMLFQEGKLEEQKHDEGMATFYYDRPSANQLFLRLTSKMSHILDAGSIINQLRMLFEYSFEDWVLFKEEKELHQDRIASIKSRKEKFGDNFGAYYYLRFFMFYAMLADMPEGGQGEGSSRGNDRQFKTLFVKAQEVINYAIKDMDENGPKYFA